MDGSGGMTITRDPNFPVEAAQLMAAFNKCADGYQAKDVLDASLQMLIASIGFRARGLTIEETEAFVELCLGFVLVGVRDNFNRTPRDTDVEVKPQ
ncbi:hypothetical protein ACVWZL_003268 [Bradyrhizobium sp. GM2.4]